MSDTQKYRWIVLITLAAGLLLITLDNSILYTALPVLTRELGASQTQLLWIINAYPLVMAGLLLGAGTLGDRVGHKRMFLIGLVVFGGASLLAAFSPSAEVLIAARAILAVGAAIMMPATLALIRVTFTDERERNLAFAIWGMLAVVGAALGPIIGGLLLQQFWWGAVFLINVPVVIAAIVATLLFAPTVSPDPTKHWDFISSAQAMIVLSGLVVAIKEFAYSESLQIALTASGVVIVGTALFLRRQARLEYPLIDFAIFKNPAFSSGVLAAAFTMFGIAGMQLTTTQRFQVVAGYTPIEAGYLVSIVAVASLPMGLIGGAFLHLIGLRILISGGLAICAIGAVVTALGVGVSMPWLIAGLILMGVGIGSALSVASTAIIGNAPVHRAGMAGAVEEVSYELGSLLSVAVLGSLVSALYTRGVMLPEGVPDAARDSIIAARALSEEVGREGQGWFAEAARAFDRAYVTVLYVISGVLAVGAIITNWLLKEFGIGSASTVGGQDHGG